MIGRDGNIEAGAADRPLSLGRDRAERLRPARRAISTAKREIDAIVDLDLDRLDGAARLDSIRWRAGRAVGALSFARDRVESAIDDLRPEVRPAALDYAQRTYGSIPLRSTDRAAATDRAAMLAIAAGERASDAHGRLAAAIVDLDRFERDAIALAKLSTALAAIRDAFGWLIELRDAERDRYIGSAQ